MQKFSLSINYVISKFEKHSLLKNKLLDCIQHDPGSSVKEGPNRISKGDFYIDREYQRSYIDVLGDHLYNHMDKVFQFLEYDQPVFQNIWYQQYYKNDIHSWHQHRASTWASVYYVELPEGTPGTLLKDPLSKEHIMPNVKEGDILTFPSMVWHCSPVNVSNNRKTIIAFNVE